MKKCFFFSHVDIELEKKFNMFFIDISISNDPNLHYYTVLKIVLECLSNNTHIGGINFLYIVKHHICLNIGPVPSAVPQYVSLSFNQNLQSFSELVPPRVP